MTNPNGPSGGWAPEKRDVPGEHGAQGGYNADETGVPPNLDRRYTDKQRTYPGAEGWSASKLSRAAFITEPTDPGSQADPSALGS